MNDEPLPIAHGFPARLIVPGLYGYVSATKWLTEIELTTLEAFDAYWVPLGWAKEAPILTQSRIDVPRHGGCVPAGRVADRGRRLGARPRHLARSRSAIDGGRGTGPTCRTPISARRGSSGASTWTVRRRADHTIAGPRDRRHRRNADGAELAAGSRRRPWLSHDQGPGRLSRPGSRDAV